MGWACQRGELRESLSTRSASMRASAARPGNTGASAGAGSTLAQRHSLAIVRLLGGLKERKEALGVGLLECAHRRRMERAVVALQAQRIIGTAGQHTFGHPRMTRRRTGTTAFIGLAQGLPIHRDDAPG